MGEIKAKARAIVNSLHQMQIVHKRWILSSVWDRKKIWIDKWKDTGQHLDSRSLQHTLRKFNKIRLKKIVLRYMWRFSTSYQTMSNHTTRMTGVSTEINGNLHFSQIWYSETVYLIEFFVVIFGNFV